MISYLIVTLVFIWIFSMVDTNEYRPKIRDLLGVFHACVAILLIVLVAIIHL